MSHGHSHNAAPDPNARIEMRDADLGIAAKVMAGIMLGLFACMGIGVLQFRWEQSQNAPSPEQASIFKTEGRLPPAPRLQAFPAADLREFQAQQQAKLNSYGWADKQGEVARVPISEGIDRVLKQGLPVRTPGQQFQLAEPRPQKPGQPGAAKPAPAAAPAAAPAKQ